MKVRYRLEPRLVPFVVWLAHAPRAPYRFDALEAALEAYAASMRTACAEAGIVDQDLVELAIIGTTADARARALADLERGEVWS